MIRPATKPELRFIRSSWAKSWNPRASDIVNGMFRWGAGRVITVASARLMHTSFVDANATTSTSLVWAVDGEPLSWVCRDLLEVNNTPLCLVHFTYTVAAARKQGLASALLRYVNREASTLGAPVKHTHLNGPGRGLLRKLQADDDQRTDPP